MAISMLSIDCDSRINVVRKLIKKKIEIIAGDFNGRVGSNAGDYCYGDRNEDEKENYEHDSWEIHSSRRGQVT